MHLLFQRIYVFLRPFLEPGTTPFLFIVGVILLNLISSAVYDYASNILGAPVTIFLLALGLLGLFIVAYALFQRLLKPHLDVYDISPRPGLVVMISQGKLSEIPATAAILYHLPALRHCWLVTSLKPGTEPAQPPGASEPVQSAWKNADDLKKKYGDRVEMEIMEIDPENPENIFGTVERIYTRAKQAGLRGKDIVADFTGGTKMMSIGMVLGCAPADRDVEYMKPRRYLPDGRADPKAGSDPKLVDLSFMLRTGGTDHT